MGILAQPIQDLAELRGQYAAAVHRQELPDLHRRTAHLRQPVGESTGIRRGQQEVAYVGSLTPGKLAGPFGDDPAGDPAGESSQDRESAQTGSGYAAF
jgi:hypothetical protein